MKKSNKFTGKANIALIITGIFSLFLTLTACQRKIYVPVETIKVITDSTATIRQVNDYIGVSDSVTVIMSGDTLIRDRVRTVVKNHLRTDTLLREITDTIRIEIPVTKTIESNSGAHTSRTFKFGFISGLSALIIILLLIYLLKVALGKFLTP